MRAPDRMRPVGGPLRQRLRSAWLSLRLEWRVLGIFGRFGLLGLMLAGALAVGLGFNIQNEARTDLLQSRSSIFTQVVDGLPIDSLDFTPGSDAYRTLDSAADLRLLGTETVRVKL